MGGCQGKIEETDEEMASQNRMINQQLRKAKSETDKTISILLLGAGQSGKSTFMKQLVRSYGAGVVPRQLKHSALVIRHFLVAAFREMIRYCGLHNLSFNPEEHVEALAFLAAEAPLSEEDQLPVAAFKQLWNDRTMQGIVTQGLVSSCETLGYFMEKIDAIADPHFVPSEEDFIMARSMTTGISENYCTYKGHRVKITDVGGQRSERRKWIHCFQDVHLIIFFASLAEYNQTLIEDPRINRMVESIRLFEEVVRYHLLKNATIILFFNKIDVFEKKIPHSPLKHSFVEYTGPPTKDDSLEFIREKYLSRARGRLVFDRVMCSVDQNCVKFIFTSLMESCLYQAFELGGL